MRFSQSDVHDMKRRVSGRVLSLTSCASFATNGTTITIHADPVSWSRPRRNGRRTFMDPRYVAAKGAVAMHVRLLWRKPVDLKGRWAVGASFYCETRRSRDYDRMLSLVHDALEGTVYGNDRQVFRDLGGEKVIGLPRGEGRTEITLRRIE